LEKKEGFLRNFVYKKKKKKKLTKTCQTTGFVQGTFSKRFPNDQARGNQGKSESTQQIIVHF
jgi:hypothetical protein